MASGEKGCKRADCHERDFFSGPVLEQQSRNCAQFPQFFRAIPADFSALQTVWRGAQSGANRSPLKFPANREKYREFAIFKPRKSDCSSLVSTFCWSYWSDWRKFAETEQGIIRPYQGNTIP